jgi:hypothetical protein
VALVHVLHHRDLELARQQQDREHRQHRQPQQLAVAGALLAGPQQLAGPRHGGRPLEQVAEAAEDPEGHEQADAQEGNELHDRLEGDRGDQALVSLAHVELPGAERDRERSEEQRDVERLVGEQRCRLELCRRDEVGVVVDDAEGVGDRLQLERDVGDDPDHRDRRHEPAEQRALAVARGDEVRDRGDAVRLADADHLAQHHQPEHEHQRRPEVDGQEADAGVGRAAHAPVERPGRGVDRERQRVHIGARDHAVAGGGAPFGVVGDREQQPEVGERDHQDDRSREHPQASRLNPTCARRGPPARSGAPSS